MPAIALLLSVVFIFLLIVLPIWTFIRAKAAEELSRRLQAEVMDLQRQVARLSSALRDMQTRTDKVNPPTHALASLAPTLPVEITPAPTSRPRCPRLLRWTQSPRLRLHPHSLRRRRPKVLRSAGTRSTSGGMHLPPKFPRPKNRLCRRLIRSHRTQQSNRIR